MAGMPMERDTENEIGAGAGLGPLEAVALEGEPPTLDQAVAQMAHAINYEGSRPAQHRQVIRETWQAWPTLLEAVVSVLAAAAYTRPADEAAGDLGPRRRINAHKARAALNARRPG